jgi:hypothetical protein
MAQARFTEQANHPLLQGPEQEHVFSGAYSHNNQLRAAALKPDRMRQLGNQSL